MFPEIHVACNLKMHGIGLKIARHDPKVWSGNDSLNLGFRYLKVQGLCLDRSTLGLDLKVQTKNAWYRSKNSEKVYSV
jgi:hypothetical protein